MASLLVASLPGGEVTVNPSNANTKIPPDNENNVLALFLELDFKKVEKK